MRGTVGGGGMAKKKDRHDGAPAKPRDSGQPGDDRTAARMKRKDYEHEMRHLHGELVAMQEWVKASGAKVCIVFEGRDTAGKGGTIKRITERVSPRVFRVVALPAPTEREKSQMYVQRYLPHFPAAGEVIIFDRSWYNRAGVEPVMGFCKPEETARFLEMVPAVEKAMVESGILLLKYWLEVSADEQTRRLKSRINDPRKIWKLSDLDLLSYSRWYDYSRARDAMFAATDTAWAPWYVAHTDDKKRGRLNIISHLLSQVPYEPLQPLPQSVGARAGVQVHVVLERDRDGDGVLVAGQGRLLHVVNVDAGDLQGQVAGRRHPLGLTGQVVQRVPLLSRGQQRRHRHRWLASAPRLHSRAPATTITWRRPVGAAPQSRGLRLRVSRRRRHGRVLRRTP
jgi:polyphosphate kinase 2